MGCAAPCDGCTSSCGDKPVADIEDYAAELKRLEIRTDELKKLMADPKGSKVPRLRSEEWFNRSDGHGLSLVYMDRYLNFGLTKEKLMSKKPIIGIAQTGSDISPCNRHHLVLVERVREGIRSAGGVALEFPTHPIQESARRPSPTLDRNLLYLALVEVLNGYPLDGIVLLTGCDKTTPACLMAAASMNIPAICLNVGPMLNGWLKDERIGTGTIMWKARELHAAGKIDTGGFIDMVTKGSPSVGHCNTMGTASTMNLLAEALGMALPGSGAIPAPYRERGQAAYKTGLQIVEMVRNDRKPSDILTREAFENAIAANTVIGGSTNAPIHLNAIAKHIGVPLDLDDWDRVGYALPLLANVMPAGDMLMEEFYRAGGLPAIMSELHEAGQLPHPEALTVNGRIMKENLAAEGGLSWDRVTIRPFNDPVKPNAGFLHLKGNLFDSAIIKTSVITPEFDREFLQDPDDPNAFECPVAVFDGPEDYHSRLEDAPITSRTILVMRGVGPLGYPGAAEVVNMHAPGHLLKRGIRDLPCIGDGRQSGTSGCPSILNASPEAADGGNLAILRDGDILRVDLTKRTVNMLVSEDEISKRRADLDSKGGFPVVESRTPWQDLFRREVGSLSEGMVMKRSVQFQRIAQKEIAPRDNH